jgi:leucyl aminopeptidase
LFFIDLLSVYLLQSSFVLSVVLAKEASKIASTYSDVFTATMLDVEKCKELKMGSYLGVVAASANPPHFIHLCYKPTDGNVKRKLVIVGKGLTFDRFVLRSTCDIHSGFMKN